MVGSLLGSLVSCFSVCPAVSVILKEEADSATKDPVCGVPLQCEPTRGIKRAF